MSQKLTADQIREARIRMHGIGRQIKDKIMNRPVMDIEDEMTRVKAQRDSLERALARATDEILNMQKHIEELEGALKAKLF